MQFNHINLKADDQLELFLGVLETRVLRLIWKFDTATIKRVYEEIQADHEVTYTTVATTMNRLVDKNILVRTRKANYYLYRSTFNNEVSFLNAGLRTVVAKFKRLGLI